MKSGLQKSFVAFDKSVDSLAHQDRQGNARCCRNFTERGKLGLVEVQRVLRTLQSWLTRWRDGSTNTKDEKRYCNDV